MIRIILADDHAVMSVDCAWCWKRRRTLKSLARQATAGGSCAGGNLKPDVAVLDITMPNMNGIEAARQISAKQPGVAIVVLSMHSDEGYVLRALKAGLAATC